MFLSNASVKKPVAMSCLIIALFLLGLNSYRKLGLENLPKLDIPYVTVLTVYPGASPEEIETDVTRKIEDTVSSIDGLKHITSTCMENLSQIVLEFQNGIDLDEAANDVRAKIDLIASDLPSTAEKPKVVKFDINAKAIISLALVGDIPIGDLYDYADNTLSDRLSAVSGVAEVQLIGGAESEVQVLLDRRLLAGQGLTALDVVQAVQSGVQTIPAGRVRQNGSEYSVKFDADYGNVRDIGSLEVANKDGSRFYLKDVGRVIMTTEELRQAAFIDGRPCIAMKIVKKADANAVEVVNGVHKIVDKIRPALPGGMKLIWVTDNGDFIQASVDSALTSIIQGVLLTSVILFLFLFDFRSTIIVAITMPLTIIISLFFMNLLGMTLNVSTLLAIGLSIGVLVTNSIVVLESITSSLIRGQMTAGEAARAGAGSVAMAVLASAGTNVVVLVPITAMTSIIGQYFRPFALATVVVTLVSLFISFTLTPILCSVFLKPRLAAAAGLLGRLEVIWDKAMKRLKKAYAAILVQIAKRRVVSLGIILASFVLLFLSMKLAGGLGFSFMPDNDRGEIYITLEYPTRYNLERTKERVKKAEELLKDLPGLQHVYTTIGKVEGMLAGTEGVYLSQILLKFVDMTNRPIGIGELKAQVRERLANYPESIISVSIPTAAGASEKPIQLEIAGDDLDKLDELALQAQEVVTQVKGARDPDTSVRTGKPEIQIIPKRPVLSDLNQSAASLGSVLRANLEGIEAGTFKRGDRTFDIRVKLEEEEGKDQVQSFLFPGEPGRPITLKNLAEIDETLAPIQISRKDKSRVSRLQANLDGSSPMSKVIDEIVLGLNELDFPPGYQFTFTGQYQVVQEAIIDFAEAIVSAMILTYLVLAAILESFTRPFIILLTLPLALIGVVTSLYLSHNSISMYILLGMVMLIGIVVNNAILIMDRLRVHTDNGVPAHEAMVMAATEQFQPIIMITLAAILGMLPLAMGSGLGSESRQGIGIASAAGIGISGLMTFFVLPAVFCLFTRKKEPGSETETS